MQESTGLPFHGCASQRLSNEQHPASRCCPRAARLALLLAPIPTHPVAAYRALPAPVPCTGAGQREDLRRPGSAAGRAAAAQPPPASQFAEAQARQRRLGPRPAPVAVEKVEAQMAEDEALKAALKLEEE